MRNLRAEMSGPVAFRKPTPGNLPHYEVPDGQLSHGSSLANRQVWVNTKASGVIERVFCNAVGKNLLGSIVVTYAVPSRALVGSSPEPGCLDADSSGYALLEPDGRGTMRVYPFKQEHAYDLTGGLHVEETVLVPKLVDYDPPAVMQRIRVTNNSTSSVNLLVTVYTNIQGDTGQDLSVGFDDSLSAFEVYNESDPRLARMVGAQGCVIAYRTTHDVSEGYAGAFAKRLQANGPLTPGPVGQIQLDMEIDAGKTDETTVVAVVSGAGMDEARRCFELCSQFSEYEFIMIDHLTPLAALSTLETPDSVINQGVFWSKINMMKVVSDYPEGPAFTNEPGKSVNVVGRDVAWYVYGCDYLDPDFSGELLLEYARKQYPSGKMPEYYNAITGAPEDYGLSMNDDTPLFVLACGHHYLTTWDKDFIRGVYSNIRAACDYILEQRDERGLVIAQAQGYDVYGIASWRNVIPGYQINGAVTEINSECYAALARASEIAAMLGEEADAERFCVAAENLKCAINDHLLNPHNGMYYLNIDTSGMPHSDVTADEVFPVLFGVAPPEVANRIISRLRSDDFMTPAGLRTVSRNSPDYDPTSLVGLKGGVWPGVAFWYAFAASTTNPGYMIEALHQSYLQYLLNPLKNNTVPGQFSEWFDGESLVNRGMRLSPWEPPRLLWAAVEGLCGVTAGINGYRVSPIRPTDWKWLALRRVVCGDRHLTFFVAFEEDRVMVFSNMPVDTPYQLATVGEDVTHMVRTSDYRVHRAAFSHGDQVTICLGTEEGTYVTTVLTFQNLIDRDCRYRVEVYSEPTDWVEVGTRRGEDLLEFAISIEDGEFRIIRLTCLR